MMHIDPRNPKSSQFLGSRLIIVGLVLLVALAVLAARKDGRVASAHRDGNTANATTAPQAGLLVISEFRLRGSGGPTDEFIEIYNNSGTSHTVSAVSGSGYSIGSSDGVVRCTIPNGTVIPAAGHYLCANSTGYSLSNYPAGSGITNANSTYVLDIPDNIGLALFNNNIGGASYTFGNRFDGVGPNSEPNGLYREGGGYLPVSATNVNFTYYRQVDQGTGLPIDLDDNATDFVFADPNSFSLGPAPHLGAPGPQNLASPIFLNNGTFAALRLDSTKAASLIPNRLRDFTSDPGNNSTLGTLTIRRRFVNNTGVTITRLRFRIIDITNFPVTAGNADLRPRSSTSVVVANVNDASTCALTGTPATPPCTVSVQGATLETPPNQPAGGGLNSTLSAGTVTLATPLATGASLNLQFLMGVETNGNYRLLLELESLPAGGALFRVSGNTSILANTSDSLNNVADFDGDGKTDLSVFRPSTGVWYLNRSLSGFQAVPFGLSTDRIVPADYDGDSKTDIAIYRPATGVWYIINSFNNTLTSIPFGIAEDLPTPADYDGDGFADLSVFRPSSGTWYRLNTGNGALFQFQFGANGDKPAVGDFDGDGLTDLSVFRPANGAWYRINSSNGTFSAVGFGVAADITVPGDYDGDGNADIAVYRPATATWYRLNSSTGAFVAIQFGAAGDIPAPGDFDGDGKEDISVFRPADGGWYRLNSSNGAFVSQAFGTNGDRPTPSAFQY